jgi:putative membrane protein insertion efficiency factor
MICKSEFRNHKSEIMQRILLFLIAVYQREISPAVGGKCACRFVPSCSEYARQAIMKHGAWRGGWLALRRISRCRPGGGMGYDPVP